MDYQDLPIPGARGEDTEALADEQTEKKKQELLDRFVEKFGANYPNLAASLATAMDVATPSTPREAAALTLPLGAVNKTKPGIEPLMTRLNNLKNELAVFQPGGGKVHELANIKAIVNGNIELVNMGQARDPKKLQEIIDRVSRFLYNTE